MNHLHADVIAAYLGRRPTPNQRALLRPYCRSISRIMRFNRDLFFALINKNKRRFFPRIGGTAAEINKRVIEYFNKQRVTDKTGRILSIIEFQMLLVTTYTDTIGVITQPATQTAYQSVIRLNYSCMTRFAETVLWSFDVAFDTGRVMGRHNVSDLATQVNRMMSEYLRRHNNTCVCYGSYSLYLLNNNISYGDIDVLQTNARTFLVNLAFLLYFVTGRNTVLLKVPFLKNYTVLQDEQGRHIIDSFNIRQDTMQKLPKVLVDSIYIIDPSVQLMTAIKMFSQIDRLEELPARREKLIARLSTLLEYVRFHFCVKFDRPFSALKLPMRLITETRIVVVDTRNYGLGYREVRCYLDEAKLLDAVSKMNADANIVDFECVSNSIFLVHKGIMHTYFSNTVLLSDESFTIHDISVRAIAAHLTLYHLLVGCNFQELLSDLLNSLPLEDKRPIVAVVDRDKKTGNHSIIDIANDLITH